MLIKRFLLLLSILFYLNSIAQDKNEWDINTPDAPGKNVSSFPLHENVGTHGD